MSTAQSGIDNLDLDRLNDTDKAELRQFLANEQQRSRIQSETHNLTQMCWKKCVTANIKNPKLDSSEEACLTNCVDRFLDLNLLVMKHLNMMRSS
ncbi:Mitochondrial import inner membrane translocase subunit TIM8 [Hirsutella minnesotensis 3608]|uniref:Mitochondrial import inner membrane translocase subunit n=1 Tax=Hirsutella minnesotensis 3608 TaxID=1043627 RepID=A0A0F8A4D0_9HYPO|nr:Mitochondrial import inner membrane translocase subunit TIM8 [Hirsutella minnesotensis 3608]